MHLRYRGCKPCLLVCLSVCLTDCTLLGLSVQAAHVDLQFELLHTASVTHAGHINRHTEARSTSMPVFAYALSLMRMLLYNVQASMLHATEVTAGAPFVLKVTLQSHAPLLQSLDVVLKDSTGFVTSGQCSSYFCMLTSNLILLGCAELGQALQGCAYCAVLCCAVLCCAILCCAVPCCAVPCCAVLCYPVPCCAVQRCAALCMSCLALPS